jgi:hypothetical protein
MWSWWRRLTTCDDALKGLQYVKKDTRAVKLHW